MPTDKIRKYILPNIPYLFIGWACLKLGRPTVWRRGPGLVKSCWGWVGASAQPLPTLRRGSIPLIGWWVLWGRWPFAC